MLSAPAPIPANLLILHDSASVLPGKSSLPSLPRPHAFVLIVCLMLCYSSLFSYWSPQLNCQGEHGDSAVLTIHPQSLPDTEKVLDIVELMMMT